MRAALGKPGITGWAQIRYPYGGLRRRRVQKLQFDLYYVKNHSLFLDMVISCKRRRSYCSVRVPASPGR